MVTSPNGQNVITVGGHYYGHDNDYQIKSIYALDCKFNLETCIWKDNGQLAHARSAHVALFLPENIDFKNCTSKYC